eukprot:TRINITY_DN242_c0_g1_i1.p1 TRINITY_DN242_c0_g1~~TRINITY_DN242_c0_g1_i1.p1  ORF type:complete len:403 (+),score=63.92 TRINITY_DN242_c0_g1_i1:58-1266(+)
MSSVVTRFINCEHLSDQGFIRDDIWVKDGVIINPRDQFFATQRKADKVIDCHDGRLVPGFIDIQINGGFGIDFTSCDLNALEDGVAKVRKGLLAHGVTSFCPTMITSAAENYQARIPKIKRCVGGCDGAAMLGLHLEGPFINPRKKGAHPEQLIRYYSKGLKDLEDCYGDLDNVTYITLAPEYDHSLEVIEGLRHKHGLKVAIGHTQVDIEKAQQAMRQGATCVTHLFNAMTAFHHRDPGVVGLLPYAAQSDADFIMYYGLIVDDYHTHDASIRLAYAMHPKGSILVTDATAAMGLEPGEHRLGDMTVVLQEDHRLTVKGTDTLAGSAITMDACFRKFAKATDYVAAARAASTHPAEMLGIDDKKGHLKPGYDADLVLLDSDWQVAQTYIAGQCVYSRDDVA